MARQAEGWKLLPPGGSRKVYRVRFRWQGVRYILGTGRSDPSEAAVEAARIYTETVSGRRIDLPVSGDLAPIVADFLAHYGATHKAGTANTAEMYFSAHFIPHFRALERFTKPSYADYIVKRLAQATRKTLQKELSMLRQFRDWLGDRGIDIAEIEKLKKGNTGIRAKNARKAVATIITSKEAKKILAAMPDRSRRTGAWVRPLFTVLWETGLRPTTVLGLEAGKHYTRGRRALFISRDIDKEEYERTIDITPAAAKALTKVFPPSGAGKLFGAKESSLRHSLAAALRDAGLEHRNISPYDFKHSRISHDANSGSPLAGIAYLVGHTDVSTTALYVTSARDAGKAVLRMRRA